MSRRNPNTIEDKHAPYNSTNRNFEVQYYKGIPLKQIDRGYGKAKARRFTVNHTSQNVWIPLRHLELDGTLKPNIDIDYVFLAERVGVSRAGVEIAVNYFIERGESG